MNDGLKRQKLEELKRMMIADSKLPLRGKANLVFGEGNAEAKILFIGEAPGFHEDQLRRPFVGQSGKLLDKMFALINIPRNTVYITNIVKRRPPQNRDPFPEEIEAYKPYLQKQIDIIEPEIIATLGRFSMNYFLPDAKISSDHGKLTRHDKYSIFPLYHPAAALRAGSVMRQLENDFRKLGALVAPPEPPPPPPTPVSPAPKPIPPQASLF